MCPQLCSNPYSEWILANVTHTFVFIPYRVIDETRNRELRHIRQVYISELVMNLHKVYFESRFVNPEYLAMSLTMVNLVAAKSWSLHKELQESKRLQEFLDQVRLSSLELLKAGKSPLA